MSLLLVLTVVATAAIFLFLFCSFELVLHVLSTCTTPFEWRWLLMKSGFPQPQKKGYCTVSMRRSFCTYRFAFVLVPFFTTHFFLFYFFVSFSTVFRFFLFVIFHFLFLVRFSFSVFL